MRLVWLCLMCAGLVNISLAGQAWAVCANINTVAGSDGMVVSFVDARTARADLLSAAEGQLVYDKADKVLKYCDGTQWVELSNVNGARVINLTYSGTVGVLRFATNPSANFIQSSELATVGNFKALSFGPLFLGIDESKLFIATNGNVGIGTHLPAQKLDVAGTVKATNFIGKLNAEKFISGDALFSSGSCGAAPASSCVIDISAGAFAGPPYCTVTMRNTDGPSYRETMYIQSITDNQLRVWRGNYGGTGGATMQLYWMCVGA